MVVREEVAPPQPDGLNPKDLVGIPWRVAFALQRAGWWLRSDIIWQKPNPMPESVKDRPTSSHEHIFLLAPSKSYYYDHEAIKEPVEHPDMTHQSSRKSDSVEGRLQRMRQPTGRCGTDPSGRNKRDVWEVTTKPYPDAHFAVYPPDLIEPCILAGSAEGDTVLDPFAGSGTTGAVAAKHGRDFVGIELNGEYIEMAERRIVEQMEESGRIDGETAEQLDGHQQTSLMAEYVNGQEE